MGVSTSADELAGKLIQGSRAVQFGTVAGVAEAAITGKIIFLANLPNRTMSNVPAKLGARFDIKGIGHPTALVRYTGPAHLLNNPTGAHTINPRGRTRTAGGRKRGGAKALKFGQGQFAAYARHPGTSGKGFFQRAVPQVYAAAPKAIHRGVHARMARVF